MVGNKDYSHDIKLIKIALEAAQVPRKWYAFSEQEDKLCIMGEYDGIHIFIINRGKRAGETVIQEWKKVAECIADRLELSYTRKLKSVISRMEARCGIITVRVQNPQKEKVMTFHPYYGVSVKTDVERSYRYKKYKRVTDRKKMHAENSARRKKVKR